MDPEDLEAEIREQDAGEGLCSLYSLQLIQCSVYCELFVREYQQNVEE